MLKPAITVGRDARRDDSVRRPVRVGGNPAAEAIGCSIVGSSIVGAGVSPAQRRLTLTTRERWIRRVTGATR